MRFALVSLSDKTGLGDLAQRLSAQGFRIISTGGTASALRDLGFDPIDLSDWTGFPEILDGRVKTLHPRAHAAILANLEIPGHRQTLSELNLPSIDCVAVNLYPFAAALDSGAPLEEMIEQIDIGGPTLIRAAAKNYKRVAVLTDPSDYLSADLDSLEARGRLAMKAFQHVGEYDAMIAEWFSAQFGGGEFPEVLVRSWRLRETLRYGENPHQQAAVYAGRSPVPGTLGFSEQLSGKPLSYNNLLDAAAAIGLCREFDEPAAVIVKHSNPCGAAVAGSAAEAFDRALECDPVSAFGGIVAFNRTVDLAAAERLTAPNRFLEAIAAPEIEPEALALIRNRKGWGEDARILRLGADAGRSGALELREADGCLLVTTPDNRTDDPSAFRVVSSRPPTEREMRDLLFAWSAAKHTKSNAIVLVKNRATVGVGAGQMNRVGSVKIACEQAGEAAKGAVLASDAFFPFADGVQAALDSGVTAIIQPGGSKRDGEVVEAVEKANAAMIFTGVRHFRH